MDVVQHGILIFSFILFLFGCSTTSPVGQNGNRNVPVTTNQKRSGSTANRNIDVVLYEGSQYLAERILQGSKIAVISIQSPAVNLSNYAVDSISMHLVNENKFVIIERTELDTIRKEQLFQASGEVSDETAVSIGKQIGAQFIVTGAILPLGDKYSFSIKIINAETAQNYGTRIYQFDRDKTIAALSAPPEQKASMQPVSEKPSAQEETRRPVINGDMHITNNNTTTINGDVYVNAPEGFGW